MDLSFDYTRRSQFYALRFDAGEFESVPFIRELRFWGVDRAPCPGLGTMAALLALKDHPVTAVTLNGVAMNPSVCTALSRQFDVEIHTSAYDVDHRPLLGGDKIVAPARISRAAGQRWPVEGTEVLTWISLDDLRGPFGGLVRTNVDAFDLTETEKDLIVALCCAGKDVGHILLKGADPALARTLHRIGLELIEATDPA
ncbi:MAG: hypothetical protein QNJ13_08690 [Paracoccaceae bacterium]|nr:hypothetical protein [Paracoccaceae bacterium]